MIINGHTQREIAEHYGITESAVSQQLKKANEECPAVAVDLRRRIESDKLDQLERVALGIMRRRHYLVSGGGIVTMLDEDSGQEVFLEDDMPTLRALQVLIQIAARRAALFGLDIPAKTHVSSEMTVRYEIAGVDMSALR